MFDYLPVFTCREADEEGEDFLPSPMARYRQLLFASLKFCLAILTSLGIENQDCGNQVRPPPPGLTVHRVIDR